MPEKGTYGHPVDDIRAHSLLPWLPLLQLAQVPPQHHRLLQRDRPHCHHLPSRKGQSDRPHLPLPQQLQMADGQKFNHGLPGASFRLVSVLPSPAHRYHPQLNLTYILCALGQNSQWNKTQ